MALWVGWGLLLLAILVGGGIRRMGDIFVSPLQGSGSRGREERALMVAEGVRQDWPGAEGTWGEGPQAVQRWGGAHHRPCREGCTWWRAPRGWPSQCQR